MKFATIAIFALLSFAVYADHVVKLTDKTFDAFIEKEETVLVKFFAPWCGHCKHLAPEFIKASDILINDENKVVLAEVDATVEEELAKRFEIHGYPTLYIFHHGEKVEYQGPREADGIVRYMRARAGPSAKPLADAAAVEEFAKGKHDIVFVGYTDAQSEFGKKFMTVSGKYRENFAFGITPATEARKDVIVAFRNFPKEDKEVVYTGSQDIEEIRKWLFTVSLPLAGIYNEDTKARYGSLPLFVVFGNFDAEHDPSGLRYAVNRLRPVAEEFRGKLHFVAVNYANAWFDELGYSRLEKFSFAIVNDEKLYASELKKFDKDAMREFANKFLAGELKQAIKSQEVVENKEGDVYVVVGKTFDEEIVNTKTDTFIVAYAPWCGHCKALLPKWEEFAKKYNKEGSVVRVAKIDATSNYLAKNYNVQGFPTIFWVPAGKGEKPLTYNGGREVADFEKYMKAHASKKSEKITYGGAAEEKKEL